MGLHRYYGHMKEMITISSHINIRTPNMPAPSLARMLNCSVESAQALQDGRRDFIGDELFIITEHNRSTTQPRIRRDLKNKMENLPEAEKIRFCNDMVWAFPTKIFRRDIRNYKISSGMGARAMARLLNVDESRMRTWLKAGRDGDEICLTLRQFNCLLPLGAKVDFPGA